MLPETRCNTLSIESAVVMRQVRFRLSINESSPLPPGQDTALLAEFELSGVEAAKAKHNDTDKISIHFRCGLLGLTDCCHITRGFASCW
jgi:hypothetical protein